MSSIESRVVTMRFDNAQFQAGIASTIASLDKLKQSTNSVQGASKGLDELNNAGKRLSGLSAVGANVSQIASRFTALGTIATGALLSIGAQAAATGTQMLKSMTLTPIMDGFREYEVKMGSIQTIMANTRTHGTTLDDVTRSLDDLNTYADKTIYSFGDMTRNIGLFTNAGLKLEDSTSMIKGFSNEAAASGTKSEQASHAAYQLSQALSAGTVRLMDWRSLTNAGMGNANMRKGLIEIAEAMGTLSDAGTTAAEIQGDFNGSLESGWLSADVMSQYLKIMAGDMDKAAMKSLGLTDAQIKGFTEQQVVAEEAATKVRTLTQLMGTMKESIGSGWASTFDIVFGNFETATELFTGINDVMSEFVNKSTAARNDVLQGWSDLGGRDMLIQSLGQAFKFLGDVMRPIGQAFRDIFPPITAQTLMNLTKSISDFTGKLKVSGQTAENIRRTFQGVFAVFDILGMLVRGVLGIFGSLIGTIGLGSGTFLEFTATIGDMIVEFRNALRDGNLLSEVFGAIGDGLRSAITGVISFVKWLTSLAQGMSSSKEASTTLKAIAGDIDLVGVASNFVKGVVDGLTGVLKGALAFFAPLGHKIGGFILEAAKSFQDGFADFDFANVTAMITAGFAAITAFFAGSIGKKISGMFDSASGAMENLFGILDQLGSTLKAYQNNLNSKTLTNIAIAIGILAGSLLMLSLIDSGKLGASILAMGALMAELAAVSIAISTFSTIGGAVNFSVVAASLMALSAAMLALSVAVKIFSTMDLGELARGLTGLAVSLAIIAGFGHLMKGASKSIIFMGEALISIAIAMNILASAVKSFAGLNWEELARGLIGLAGALGALAIFSKLGGLAKGAAASGAGLILLAVGLRIIASALNLFGGMDWGTLGKGLLGMAAALGILAVAMRLMPMNMPLMAVGMVALAAALNIMAAAMQTMGSMSWVEIAKSMVVLAGSLTILAIALYAMTGAIAGAAALVVAAAALMMLAPAMLLLGGMSWRDIGAGLTMLAGVFLVLAVAGIALTPVVPTLIGLGAAILLLGAGVAAAGVGVALLATGLTALGASLGVATVGIVGLVAGIVGLIPMILTMIAKGIVQLVQIFLDAHLLFVDAATKMFSGLLTAFDRIMPQLITTMTKLIVALLQAARVAIPQFVATGMAIMTALLDAVLRLGPKIIQTMVALIRSLVNAIVGMVSFFVDAGLRLVTGILNGIARNVGKIVTAGTNIVVQFINGISRNIPRVIQSGINLVINFVNSLANGIRSNQGRMDAAGANLASAIINGMVGGLARGVGRVIGAAANVAANALNAAKGVLGINSPSREFFELGAYSTEGMANGLTKTSRVVEKASERVGKNAMSSLKETMGGIDGLLTRNMNLTPTVRPVLDLTDIRKGASKVSGLLRPNDLRVEGPTRVAEDIRARQDATYRASHDAPRVESKEVTMNFTQNNTSPKSLSSGDIYRQTKSQLSTIKEGLTI